MSSLLGSLEEGGSQLEMVACTSCIVGCKAAMQKSGIQGSTGLTVEQVRVVFGWQPVDVKDVEQVKVLAMHIAAHCQLAALGNRNIHQGWKPSEYVICLHTQKEKTTSICCYSKHV